MSARLGAGTHVGLVGRWITATLEDGSTHLGVVHTVDPETGNMVLLRESSDGPKNFVLPTMLFYHAIRAVHPHGTSVTATDLSSGDTATSLVPASRYATAKPDQTEIDRRRAVICEALSRQRVPYALQQPANGHIAGDDIVVLGTLVCSAPYMSSSIQCENEMVLGRFRELLRALDV
mmetsp:Transcript_12928/g.42308  ORF Transcript_12928/g.42308 Transcript_12928/m.42308 type:complete len:177 (+) Transcript_12928:8-538(+)